MKKIFFCLVASSFVFFAGCSHHGEQHPEKGMQDGHHAEEQKKKSDCGSYDKGDNEAEKMSECRKGKSSCPSKCGKKKKSDCGSSDKMEKESSCGGDKSSCGSKCGKKMKEKSECGSYDKSSKKKSDCSCSSSCSY